MRYRQILTEAPYDNMFDSVVNLFDNPMKQREIRSFTRKLQKDAKDALKRQDRVVWFLKFAKERLLNSASDDNALDTAKNIISFNFTEFKHYIDLNIPEINEIIWNKQDYIDLRIIFRDIEDKNREEQRVLYGQQVEITNKQETIIDFGDGYKWVNLNVSGCPEEGRAMGHCGNGVGQKNETVLSLRQTISDKLERPCLTFIIDSDGYLGEMKGRGNSKPAKKYHPYIIKLLMHDMVRGITPDAGYMPENNFKTDYLEPSAKEDLLGRKPELFALKDHYEIAGISEGLISRLSRDFLIHKYGEDWLISEDGRSLEYFITEYHKPTAELLALAFLKYELYEYFYTIPSISFEHLNWVLRHNYNQKSTAYNKEIFDRYDKDFNKILHKWSSELLNRLGMGRIIDGVLRVVKENEDGEPMIFEMFSVKTIFESGIRDYDQIMDYMEYSRDNLTGSRSFNRGDIAIIDKELDAAAATYAEELIRLNT